MYKQFFFAASLSFILFSTFAFAQESPSFRINGGMIYPKGSSTGLSGLIQFNYPLNEKISFYLYTGSSVWDKKKSMYMKDFATNDNEMILHSYSADDHSLVPVYIGSSFNMHTNNFCTAFLNVELGYSYLSFNSYNYELYKHPETGEVLGFYADQKTRKNVTQNLVGLGLGAGISHPMTDDVDLTITFKLNNVLNANNWLFNYEGTYTMLLAGLNFNI